VKEAVKAVVHLVSKLKDAIKEVDKMGAEAHAKKLTKPEEVFWALHPGAKMKSRQVLLEHRAKDEEEKLKHKEELKKEHEAKGGKK